jgi:hypothetical protein
MFVRVRRRFRPHSYIRCRRWLGSAEVGTSLMAQLGRQPFRRLGVEWHVSASLLPLLTALRPELVTLVRRNDPGQ